MLIKELLTELAGIKQHPAFQAAQAIAPENEYNTGYSKEQATDLNSQLKKLGWTLTGQGHYSLVYKNPKYDYVLKVFTSTNQGWLQYVQYVLSNQNNPFVPKMSKPRKISSTAWACKMEKLEPIKNENVIWKNYVGPDLQPQLTNNNAMELAWSVKNFPFLQEHYPQLYHLVDHLYSTGWGSGNLDLEGGSNIMRRGNVPVITDPVAG